MSLGLAFAVALMVDPRAHRVDVSGGVDVETRVGQAPIDAISDPEPSFMFILTPRGDLSIRARRGGEWSLGYSPRMQVRLPNRLSLERPLFLHQVYSDYRVFLSPKWLLDTDVSVSVGELDYTTIALALGPEQGAPPADDVTEYFVGEAAVRLRGLLDPRNAIVLTPRATFRTPLGNDFEDVQDSGATLGLPRQTFLSAGVGHEHRATPVDIVTTTVTPGYVDNDERVRYGTAQGRVLWQRALTSRLETRLDGGLFYAQRLWASPLSEVYGARTWKVFPVGGFAFLGRLRSRASHAIDGSVGAAVDSFIDRLGDTIEPRAGVRVDLTTTLPPDWSVGVNASAFTPLTSSPRLTGAGQPIYESVVQGQTPVRYTIDERSTFEFGMLASVRFPQLVADSLETNQFELWGYVAFRIGGGTRRGGGETGRGAPEELSTGFQGAQNSR